MKKMARDEQLFGINGDTVVKKLKFKKCKFKNLIFILEGLLPRPRQYLIIMGHFGKNRNFQDLSPGPEAKHSGSTGVQRGF